MWERNDGTGESNILQNQFTKYFMRAIQRHKNQYLQKKYNHRNHEVLIEDYGDLPELRYERDMTLGLPVLAQLEDQTLRKSLEKAGERDLYIFVSKVMDNRSLVEIAEELGVSYAAAAVAYHRMVKRIKSEIGVEEQ